MEMIDRYLQAVGLALPAAQRDDIIKELRDSILSQTEEREAVLGRPLGEDEQVELLKKLGSPWQLASRYRKQRHLIGAALFPIYGKVLRASLGLAFLVLAIASIATAAAGKTFSSSLAVLFRYPGVALMTFAWITLAFAALEYFGARFKVSERWDPRRLPPLGKADTRKSQFELIAQLAVQTVFGVWWLAGLHYQYLILGPGFAFLRFGPIWHTVYPLFVVLVTVDLALTASRFAWPQWRQGGAISRLVMSVLGLVVLGLLINTPDLFVPSDPGTPQLQSLAKTIQYGANLGLIAAAVVSVFNIVRESVRLLAHRLGRVHQAAVGG
jgi:hypothetical protein